MISRLKNIYEYRNMIYSLVRRELRGRYKGSFLGFLWTFINPLCQIIVYTMVFSIIMKTGIEKFYLYLITGMIPWIFFSNAVLSGAGCIWAQADMVKKIYFPREVVPISYVTSGFVNMLFCFVVVFFVIFVSGTGVSLKALTFLPLIMLIEYALALGITLIISAWTVFIRDLEQIVGVLMMAWIYLTPILYSLESVPQQLLPIFKLNPMTSIIMAYHKVLYDKMPPELSTLAYSGVVSVFILIIGMIIFSKLERSFAEEL